MRARGAFASHSTTSSRYLMRPSPTQVDLCQCLDAKRGPEYNIRDNIKPKDDQGAQSLATRWGEARCLKYFAR